MTWGAAAPNGSAITNYSITWTGGGGPQLAAAGATSAVVSNLVAGQNYQFTVAAINAFGTGSGTTTAAVTIGDVPAAPTGEVACEGNTSAKFVWTGVAGASSYNLYVGTSLPFNASTWAKTAGVTSPHFSGAGAFTNGTRYYAAITAVDALGDSAPSNIVSFVPDTVVHDMLVVSGYQSSNVEIFDCYSQTVAGGSSLFGRVLNNSGIVKPEQGSVFVDANKATIYLSNTNANAVYIWNDATNVNGAAAPNRIISGTSTGLSRNSSVYYDATHDRLYVGNENTNQVFAWAPGSTAGGNIAPTASITVGASPYQIFIDEATDELYVAGFSKVFVYSNASTIVGSASPSPSRTVLLSGLSQQSIFSVWVDTALNRLWFGESYPPPNGPAAIYSFSPASTQNGTLTAGNSISGVNHFVDALWVKNDQLFAAQEDIQEIWMWTGASALNGGAAPTKIVKTAVVWTEGIYYVP